RNVTGVQTCALPISRRIGRAHLGLGEGGWPLAAAPPSGDAAGQLLSSYRAGLVPGGPGPRWSSSSGGGSGHGVISGGVGEEPAAPCGLVQIQAPGGADGSESDSSAVSAPLAGRGSGRSAPVPERLSGLRTHRPCSLSRLRRARSPWPFGSLVAPPV